MRRSLEITVVILLLGTATGLLAGGAAAETSPGAEAAKKGKRLQCKGSKIPVKIGKRRTCRAIGSVIPPPQQLDPRFAFLKAALDFKPPEPKGGKGKGGRSRTMKTGFGGAGKQAYGAIVAALPKLLAKVDEAAPERAPPVRSLERSAVAANGCPNTSSQTSQFGDGGVNATVTFTGVGASMVITFSVSGHDFRIEYETSEGCGDFAIPRCPTATGRADAQRTKSDRALIQVRKGGQLVSSQSTSGRRVTKTQGQTAADALLDYIDVQDSIRMNIAVNGQAINGTLNRNTRIDMRSGTYVPAQSSASFAGAQALQNLDRGGFAALANGVIYRYRTAESGPETLVGPPGWAVYERSYEGSFCVRAEFDPATNTAIVRKNEDRILRGRVLLNGGGGQPSDGRWNVYETQNGVFGTPNPQGASVSIPFRATMGNDGDLLIGRYRVSSTAGVTRSSWNAEIDVLPTINRIAGTFNGDFTLDTVLGPSVSSFSGNLQFLRSSPAVFAGADGFYTLSAGSYSLAVSGIDSSLVTGCSQTGTGSFTIPAGQGNIAVDGTPPDQVAPYSYTFLVFPQLDQTLTATRVDCPPGAEAWEGTTFTTGLSDVIGTQDSETSDDGISYVGSYTEDGGSASFSLSWSLTGSES